MKKNFCRKCGAELPVPAWKTCNGRCPKKKKKEKPIKPIKIKKPDDEKYYLGMRIRIPFWKMHFANTLVVDDDYKNIIGYSQR
jgi:hypothetical protein